MVVSFFSEKLLAVLRQQKQMHTAAKVLQSSVGDKNIWTEEDTLRTDSNLSETPRRDPRPAKPSLDSKIKEPVRHGPEKSKELQANKSGENIAAGFDAPLPEKEARVALRSPHIAVSGGKVMIDYGSYRSEEPPEVVSATAIEVQQTETAPYMELSNVTVPNYNPNFGYNYELPETNGQEQSGLSYGKVFGMSAYDYAFDFVPPAYRRHRRHSDSDSESVRNFMSSNMPIHGILELEEKKSTPLQPMKWISKKTRKKSEDQRRKAFPVR